MTRRAACATRARHLGTRPLVCHREFGEQAARTFRQDQCLTGGNQLSTGLEFDRGEAIEERRPRQVQASGSERDGAKRFNPTKKRDNRLHACRHGSNKTTAGGSRCRHRSHQRGAARKTVSHETGGAYEALGWPDAARHASKLSCASGSYACAAGCAFAGSTGGDETLTSRAAQASASAAAAMRNKRCFAVFIYVSGLSLDHAATATRIAFACLNNILFCGQPNP